MISFQDLYDLNANEVYRLVFWLSGDRFEAEGITPETYVRVWVRFNTIRTETLKAYLFTIDSNTYYKKRRNINRVDNRQP